MSRSHKSVHFIGIGGSGMRPLAELALARGYTVTGSDQAASKSTQVLQALGAEIFLGHSSQTPSSTPDYVVASTAIRQDNPELQALIAAGWPILHRSEFLYELMQGKKAICVSGTHGKTSTTAMIAHMLDELGLQPAAAIGGEIIGKQRYSYGGDGEYFVAECDESDGSFLRYEPFLSIITNIDLDHLDYYKDIDGLKRAFLSFLEKTSPEGTAILGWDNAALRDIAPLYSGNKLSFGMRIGSEVRGLSLRFEEAEMWYDAIIEKTRLSHHAPVVGRHNFLNILCCLSVARALDLDLEMAAKALASYRGVGRRFSEVARFPSLRIFDDYAHNPGKIQSCVEGAREAFPQAQLVIIFQPHRYSRLETMYNELMSSFQGADWVFVLPVYTAGEQTSQDFAPHRLAKDIETRSKVKAAAYDEASIFELLRQEKTRESIIVTVGAGDVSELSYAWKDKLHEFTQEKEGLT